MSDFQNTGTKTKIGTPKIELSISCRNNGKIRLKTQDLVCITYKKANDETNWVKLGKTESQNSKNEFFEYIKKVVLDYNVEESQKTTLKFTLCKFDDANDIYASVSCTLAQMVTNKQVQLKLKTTDASIVITAEELSDVNDELTLTFGGYKLDKKDKFRLGKSDPYLVVSKSSLDSTSFVAVHRTEVIENNVSPNWKPFTIPVRNLCNGDYNRRIRLQCFDYDSKKKSQLIGECITTLKDLSEFTPGKTHRVFECINHELNHEKKGYKNSGEIHLKDFSLKRVYSFMDYIRGGLQLNCVIAIDFTASNKNQSENLHFISPDQKNPYQQAMHALADNMKNYDSDNMFHVLGFGAKLPGGRVSHNFNVNMKDDNPQVSGVEGVFDAYRSCLEKIELYGPTNFAEVMDYVSDLAKKHQAESQQYYILLILTDGIIDDEKETIKAVVTASSLPISIVIVGIGNAADFKTMNKLDADKTALNSEDGAKAKRDIVHFIDFQAILNAKKSTANSLLAKEMLSELPTQLMSYMKMNGISPGPRITHS